MAAYVIGHIHIKDAEKWAEYRSRVPATLAPWGGNVLFRGHLTAVLSGNHQYTDVVVIEFSDAKTALGWYRSADYEALIPLRNEAADMVLVSYES